MAFISKLTLENFLSFKKKQELTFDSTVNVICGRNGSGKSNVYIAFCHIFTDMYDKQSVVERTRTLFDSGKCGSEASISVEVVGSVKEADNNNISIIKKIITPYKQELYCNDEPVSRKDLNIILESLGFQCINKYIILKQGEVITAKDFNENSLFKILLLFFNIGESVTWEGKCKNTIESCRERVHNIHNSINSKRQLYTCYSETVTDYEKISGLSILKSAISKKLKLSGQEDFTADMERVNSMIKDCESEHERLCEKKDNFVKNTTQIIQRISECRSEISSIQDKIGHNNGEIYQKSVELKKTIASFDNIKNELEEVTAKKTKIRSQINQVSAELDTAQQTYASLKKKIGEVEVTEKDQLSSKISSISRDLEERKEFNAFLENGSSQERVDKIDADIQKFSGLLAEERKNVDSLTKKHGQAEKDIHEIKARIERTKLEINQHDEAVINIKANIEKVSSEKNEILSNIDEIKKNLQDGIAIQSPVEEYYTKQKCFGLKAIEEYFNYKNLYDIKNTNYSQYSETYYGLLCDVFHCNNELAEKFVQLTTSKSTLLGVVINDISETKTIKSILAKINCKEKVNLYPLEKYKNMNVRRLEEPNVTPLLDYLTFDEKFKNLIIATFGDWYIVEDIRTAYEIGVKYKVNCITNDFSVYKRNGQISCGVSRTSLNVFKTRQKFLEDQEEYSKKLANIEKLHTDLMVLNRKLPPIDEEIDSLQSELNAVENERTSRENDVFFNETRLSDLERSFPYIKKEISNATKRIEELNSKIEKLNDFRNREMNKRAKDELSREIADLEEELKSCTEQMNALMQRNKNLLMLPEQEKQIEFLQVQHESFLKMLDVDMGEHRLLQQRDELQKHINDQEKVIRTFKQICENLNSDVSELELKCKGLNGEKDNMSSCLKNTYDKIDACLEKTKDLQRQLDKYRGYSERLSQYQLTVEEEQAFDEYRHHNIEELKEEYEKINSRYESVSLFKSEDIMCMKEYINDYDFVSDSSTSASNQIMEASNFTEILASGKDSMFIEGSKFIFKLASNLFKKFFPDGEIRFQLALKKSVTMEMLTLKDIKGVKIKVKTSSDGGYIECGFSGGQRNVITLCLIIACHNHFSCPFMCFDEIEADLDTVFRTSFVEIIKLLSYKNQIFLTTFREETTNIGASFYQIASTENGSIATRISKEEALALIER